MMMFNVYNKTGKTITINKISWQHGESFMLNVDGETNLDRLRNLQLPAHDSLFVFLKTNPAKQTSNNAVMITDAIIFDTDDAVKQVVVEAYAQNVEILRNATYYVPAHMTATKPYHVFDTLIFATDVVIDPGTRFYMHSGSVVYCLGNVTAEGTTQQPILFRGDRFDELFKDVPYDYASGNWFGIFLLQPQDSTARTYSFNNTIIRSAAVGLYAQAAMASDRPTIKILNSSIYNMTIYGVAIQNMDALIANCEISNCSANCVYLAGGKHTLIHNTIASYFNQKDAPALHNVGREDVSAVFINNISKNRLRTESYFYNNIIAGVRANNLTIASPFVAEYKGEFKNNYLINDSIEYKQFENNIFGTKEDTVFVSTMFVRDEQRYYDFRLDSVSPARHIADQSYSILYPLDRDGNERPKDEPSDAGCYQSYYPESN